MFYLPTHAIVYELHVPHFTSFALRKYKSCTLHSSRVLLAFSSMLLLYSYYKKKKNALKKSIDVRFSKPTLYNFTPQGLIGSALVVLR